MFTLYIFVADNILLIVSWCEMYFDILNCLGVISGESGIELKTRNSSGDEIANVNFLYDDIVHAQKYNRLLHKLRHRSFSATQVYEIQ